MSERNPHMPATTPDYMAGAWYDCLSWAIGEPKVREDFEKATGHRWVPPRNGIEAAIDKATGADKAYIDAFVKWFNECVWGDVEAANHER